MNLTLNGLPIIVDQVAAEEIVQRHLQRRSDEQKSPELLDWAEQFNAWKARSNQLLQLKPGEKYLGAHCGPDGKLVHTILLPGVARGKNWQAAMEWAVDQGGYLPNRIEGAMLFAYLKSEFENEVYWLGEQYADVSDYAWGQGFSYGSQYLWHKDDKLMARAVRRVSI
jgi:hypothetical protein